MNPSTFHERRMMLEAICAAPALPGNALKLAMTLMAFVNAGTGKCCPSQRTIKARCHLCRNTIDAMGRALEDHKWLWIERDKGGDRDANSYHFAFHRVREGGDHYGFSLLRNRDEVPLDEMPEDKTGRDEFHGSKVEPCSMVHGSTSERFMAQDLTEHGSKVEPELTEKNSQNGTQESLFGADQLPKAPPFDFDPWWNQQWWPHYPLKVDEISAKKLCRATIEGRRGDALKATPDELVAGVLRFAGAMMGTSQRYIMHPTKWLEKGRWTDKYDERAGFGGRRASASTEAVYRAGAAMTAGNKRAVG